MLGVFLASRAPALRPLVRVLGQPVHFAPALKEGSGHAVLRQSLEDVRRTLARPVVERERESPPVARSAPHGAPEHRDRTPTDRPRHEGCRTSPRQSRDRKGAVVSELLKRHSYATGNSKSIRSPGLAFVARIAPRWSSTARRAMESPSPMPPLSRLRSDSTR